jgi:penicillin-binding protein 4B
MKKSRIYFVLVCLSLLFGLIVFRLANIQLIQTESFGPKNVNLLEKSVDQRSHQITLSNGRGTITDRNGNELTNKRIYDVVIFPGMKDNNGTFQELAAAMHTSVTNLTEEFVGLESPTYLSDLLNKEITEDLYKKLNEMDIGGIYPIERTLYQDPMLAQHFIGLVRQNPDVFKEKYDKNVLLEDIKPVGISGIEEAFDKFLISKEEEKLLFHVDAIGKPLFGFDLKYSGFDNGFYPLKVQTTLDIALQQKAEEVLSKYDIKKGGIVLLDVESRDILAMASKPVIDLTNPYRDNTLINQMLEGHSPGSVFKTVVAAAALENLKVDNQRTFDCSMDLYNKKPAKRELGVLTFEQSFAESCNRTFGQLAIELMDVDPNLMEDYARKLGLVEPVGWKGDVFQYPNFKQFPNERSGVIWQDNTESTDPNYVLQTAIGQRNVKVTPLAVANMMATIASDGVKKEVRGVNQISYKNGATMAEFETKQLTNQINPYTAVRLRKLMHKVTENGTATTLKGLEVAGKSGTAETGEDDEANHHWFGGFFPYEKPKYAMVIVDLDNPTGTTNIYQAYKEMVEFIYN